MGVNDQIGQNSASYTQQYVVGEDGNTIRVDGTVDPERKEQAGKERGRGARDRLRSFGGRVTGFFKRTQSDEPDRSGTSQGETSDKSGADGGADKKESPWKKVKDAPLRLSVKAWQGIGHVMTKAHKFYAGDPKTAITKEKDESYDAFNERQKKLRRHNRILRIGVTVGGVAVAAVASYFIMRNGLDGPQVDVDATPGATPSPTLTGDGVADPAIGGQDTPNYTPDTPGSAASEAQNSNAGIKQPTGQRKTSSGDPIMNFVNELSPQQTEIPSGGTFFGENGLFDALGIGEPKAVESGGIHDTSWNELLDTLNERASKDPEFGKVWEEFTDKTGGDTWISAPGQTPPSVVEAIVEEAHKLDIPVRGL